MRRLELGLARGTEAAPSPEEAESSLDPETGKLEIAPWLPARSGPTPGNLKSGRGILIGFLEISMSGTPMFLLVMWLEFGILDEWNRGTPTSQ